MDNRPSSAGLWTAFESDYPIREALDSYHLEAPGGLRIQGHSWWRSNGILRFIDTLYAAIGQGSPSESALVVRTWLDYPPELHHFPFLSLAAEHLLSHIQERSDLEAFHRIKRDIRRAYVDAQSAQGSAVEELVVAGFEARILRDDRDARVTVVAREGLGSSEMPLRRGAISRGHISEQARLPTQLLEAFAEES